MSGIVFRLRTFISYLWHGKSRYHVHSDFVYKYINAVLLNKDKRTVFNKIEQLRLSLSNNSQTVTASIWGAKTSKATTVAQKTKATALPPLYGRLLHRTATYFNSAQILELGTGTGISTLYMATALSANKVITLEGNPDLATIAQKGLTSLGITNTQIIIGDFNSTLAPILGNFEALDLVFIDGDHKKNATLKYFEQLMPYTHNNTILVFDDINWSPEMLEAWQTIIARPEVTLSINLYRLGLVFFRKEFRQPQHLQLYYW